MTRKLRKRLKRLERRVAELEAARVMDATPVDVSGDPLDVIGMWLGEHVSAYMHGWDDDEDWSGRGYL